MLAYQLKKTAGKHLRGTVGQLMNLHVQGQKPNLVLLGSRRSGSTLLMQMIAQEKGMKPIDQPFSPYVATRKQIHKLPRLANSIFIHPDADERRQIIDYLQLITSGALHINEPWRLWSKEFNFRSNRLVLKTTAGQFIRDILIEQGFIPIHYFRHPIAQSLSCIRAGWGDKLDLYSPVCHRLLGSDQLDMFEFVTRRGSQLQRFVLSWAIENQPLFECDGQTHFIFMEELILNPNQTCKALAAFCNLSSAEEMEMVTQFASQSVNGISTDNSKREIDAGRARNLISDWRKILNKTQIEEAQKVLDHFPFCPYEANQDLPLHKRHH